MKIRVLFHSIKESFHNVFSHMLLTLASLTTMTLMLILLGAFAGFSLNASQLVRRISQQPPVEVFLKVGAPAQSLDQAEQVAQNFKGTLSCEKVTSEENFKKFKDGMGDEGSVLDYFDSSQIPASLIVRLKSPEELTGFRATIEGVPGVERIDYNEKISDTLIQINRWVRVGSLIVFGVLCLVAFFIISNMVRISVFSRGAEIEIMKYIGATNTYIRIPYILEGAIIGIFGALISWIVLYFSYEAIFQKLMINTPETSPYALLPVGVLSWRVALITGILGIAVGMIGSSLSVRRHVKV